jgi:hypothetical protein
MGGDYFEMDGIDIEVLFGAHLAGHSKGQWGVSGWSWLDCCHVWRE